MKDIIHLIRPHQFIKNGFIFLPLFFGHKLMDPLAVISAGIAFITFCMVSASVYVFNDIRDIEEDRSHPVKCNRPLASGRLSVGEAYIILAALLAGSLIVALFSLSSAISLSLLFYLLLNLAYSLKLKQWALIDVVCIAVGFVLRVHVGSLASNVDMSHWLALMTFLLALFLALGKRYDDFKLSSKGATIRQSVTGYNLEFIQASMVVMAAVTIVCYIMYTVAPQTEDYYGRRDVYMTTFWVILGILRYLQLTFVYGRTGSPTLVMFRDRFTQAVILGWLATFFYFLYALSK